MLIIYLAILVTALYWVLKVLMPEMAKPPLPKIAPEADPFDFPVSNGVNKKTELLETLLAEKNKNISILQTELKVLDVQVRAFDKVKLLLEEEIHRLREQNRIFRSELGLPAIQIKESSIT